MKPIVIFSSSATYTAALRKLFCREMANSHTIVEAEAPADFLSRPEFAEQVYLVILDTAPNQCYDGYALIGQLRARNATAGIPIVVLASQEDKRDRLKAASMDVQEYLVFPVTRGEVLLKVRNSIEHYLENRNMRDGLTLLTGFRTLARESEKHKEKLEKQMENLLETQEDLFEMSRRELVEMDSMRGAQEAVSEMSRQELLAAHEKLKQSYEAKLNAVNEKNELQMIFGKFISPEVVEYLMQRDGIRTLMGEKKDLSVLFADLRGFTAMSEHMEPQKVVVLLNEFFNELTETVIRHNGIIDKYSGDNIMAIFGAPLDMPDHHEAAILAAVEMQEKFAVIKRNWHTLYGVSIGLGIGLNCGPAIAGNLGSYHKISYTVIGDIVNTAARFEQLATDGQIVCGKYVHMRLREEFLGAHGLTVETLGETIIKGKTGTYTIYNIHKHT